MMISPENCSNFVVVPTTFSKEIMLPSCTLVKLLMEWDLSLVATEPARALSVFIGLIQLVVVVFEQARDGKTKTRSKVANEHTSS